MPQAGAGVDKPGHKHWSNAHVLHDGHILDGVLTSNYVEQENASFLPSRWKHPLYFLMDFAQVVTTLVSAQRTLALDMAGATGDMACILPAIQAKCKQQELLADQYKEIC